MNPFEEEEISIKPNDVLSSKFDITIWKESRGRKTNTYISGWNIKESDLKQHIKDFKKTHGCNGSLKNENDNFVLHFQGDKIDKMYDFIIEKGVEKDMITIKGQ